MTFAAQWRQCVEAKDSILCAGLDPAEYAMGRGKKGLKRLERKREWSLRYLETVAPYCAAVKYNICYWKDAQDGCVLGEITNLAHNLGLLVIEDCKLSDIGSTNEAAFFYAARRGVDALTYSPFAGNMAEASRQAHSASIGIICLCLMSNPEYGIQKHTLVPCGDVESIPAEFTLQLDGVTYMQRYLYNAYISRKNDFDGVVVGAPSDSNHISEKEIDSVGRIITDRAVVLIPGIGAQGGKIDAIMDCFSYERLIMNIGRDLMFPDDADCAFQARKYKNYFNRLRDAHSP